VSTKTVSTSYIYNIISKVDAQDSNSKWFFWHFFVRRVSYYVFGNAVCGYFPQFHQSLIFYRNKSDIHSIQSLSVFIYFKFICKIYFQKNIKRNIFQLYFKAIFLIYFVFIISWKMNKDKSQRVTPNWFIIRSYWSFWDIFIKFLTKRT